MDSYQQSEARDFGEILSQSIHGSQPLVVGGHAINIWAQVYKERIQSELEHAELLPLTSKDLDLYGTRELLEQLRARFGGSVILGEARSPVIGQLEMILNGKQRTIEVLRSVRGMSSDDLENGWLPVVFEGYSARVPLPTCLLKAKMANATQIDQTDRNYIRHVRILILVIREHLIEVLRLAETEKIESRLAIGMLEETRELVLSGDAERCLERYDISFDGIWPMDEFGKAQNKKIRNFIDHRIPRPTR